MRKGKKKGFTLVELIVVITILAILAAVITPKVTGFTSQAKVAKIKTNASTILNAIETYNAGVSDDATRIGGDNVDFKNPVVSGIANLTLDATYGANLKDVISKLDAVSDSTVLLNRYEDLKTLIKTGVK